MGDTGWVLLVDDNLADVEAMRQAIIEYWPLAELRVAGDGEQALHLLAHSERMPGLIILDLHLGNVHGREVLLNVKADAKTCHIPAIILTGTDDAIERQACLDAGAAGFFTKPVTFRAFGPLIEQLRNLLGAGTRRS